MTRVLQGLLATTLLSLTSALAQEADNRAQFDIPPQALDSALLAFSDQADVQVVVSADAVKGLSTRGVSGRFSAPSALRTLLAHTGLQFDVFGDRTYSVGPIQARSQPVTDGAPAGAASATDRADAGDGPASPGDRSDIEPDPDSEAGGRKSNDSESQRLSSEEIIVTGSRLGTPLSESALPVKTLSRDDIERSGALTLAHALNVLPEVSVSSTTSPLQNGRGSSTVQLRGLPGGTTLILLNGRRLPETPINSSEGITNLNVLPLAAIQRIDVLPSGSSAIYGGDALAGVVNIVLKRDAEGLSLNAHYGGADGYYEEQGGLSWGTSSERASLLFVGSYSRSSELNGSERDITANNDYRRFGGPDLSVSNANPGNVFSLNAQNLPGLNSTFAGIPDATNGVGLTPGSFAATAGQLNLNSSRYSAYSQRPYMEQYSGLLNARVELGANTELFGELLYAHYEPRPYLTSPIVAGRTGSVRIPATNPFNPFGVNLGVEYVFEGVRFCQCVEQEYAQGRLGSGGSLGSWEWQLAAAYARGKDQAAEGPLLDNARLNAALADTNPASSLNLFADRTWTNEELAPFLTTRIGDFTSDLRSVDGFVRGTLFEWFAGPVKAVVGAEYTESELDYNYVGVANVFQGDRDAYAVFGELRVPLMAGRSQRSSERLALTGAVRFDDYSDFGNRTSPEIGLEVRPFESLLVRGAYSTAFKPPTLFNLFSPVRSFPNVPIRDPLRGNQSYPITLVQGGNPDLEPLTGETTSMGLVFAPFASESASMSWDFRLTHWQIEIENFASVISFQTMVNQESLFTNEISRGPQTPADVAAGVPGQIAQIRNIFVNFGTFELAGVDLTATSRVRTGLGELVPSITATRTYEYDAALIPGAPVEDRVSRASLAGYAPKWKGSVGLRWSRDRISGGVTGRYVGEYTDHAPATRELGDFWFLDVNARYDLPSTLLPRLSDSGDTYVSIGAVNVLDTLPQYSGFGLTGYDPTQADIRGRFVYAHVGLTF
jgi:iron complex outermembrane recepter protein